MAAPDLVALGTDTQADLLVMSQAISSIVARLPLAYVGGAMREMGERAEVTDSEGARMGAGTGIAADTIYTAGLPSDRFMWNTGLAKSYKYGNRNMEINLDLQISSDVDLFGAGYRLGVGSRHGLIVWPFGRGFTGAFTLAAPPLAAVTLAFCYFFPYIKLSDSIDLSWALKGSQPQAIRLPAVSQGRYYIPVLT